MLETSLLFGAVGWILFDIYRQGQKQKLAILALLENMKNNQTSKVDTVNKFLQNRLHLTGPQIKKQEKIFLQQELSLLQEIMKLPSVGDKELLQIYNKLQVLLLLYCSTKPPSELNEDKNFQPKTSYEEFLSICQAKFIGYLESKDLIVTDIRSKIHAFDKEQEQSKSEKNKEAINSTNADVKK